MVLTTAMPLGEPHEIAAWKTPPETAPLAEAERGAWLDGPDLITALRRYDGGAEYALPPRASFTLGASRSCDVAIHEPGLSAAHGRFERRRGRLRLIDLDSTNGTSFGGRRVDAIDLYPGDTFTAGGVTLLALDEPMRAHRPAVAELVGEDGRPSPDALLVEAVKGAGHLLLTGEHGCEPDRLGRAIHAVSLRRQRAPVELARVPPGRAEQRAILDRARRSTLLLDLRAPAGPLDPAFCELVFAPEYEVRVLAVAQAPATARRLVPAAYLAELRHVGLRPLARRRRELPALLDRLLAERGAALGLADLTAKNRAALLENEWRDNLIGLRTAAERLAAISRVRGWEGLDWRERGAAIGVAKSTLHDWFTALGLSTPLAA